MDDVPVFPVRKGEIDVWLRPQYHLTCTHDLDIVRLEETGNAASHQDMVIGDQYSQFLHLSFPGPGPGSGVSSG